ncbi:phosphatase PAP2 family protein [Candidatus Uhrbacteria bacterium]|nr:phosphatase PAP2 family protein [Candidatus Uhrbacteria bacterium]
MTNSIDLSLFYFLHGLAGRSTAGDAIIVLLGKHFVFVIMLIFAVFALKAWRKGGRPALRPYALAIVSVLVARLGVISVVRFYYHRPRPFLALSLPHLLTDHAYSFPSGHTIFMFSLATVTTMFNRRLGYFFYASGLLIGLARVAGGVHYPSDILGGIVLGMLTGWLVCKTGTSMKIFRGWCGIRQKELQGK